MQAVVHESVVTYPECGFAKEEVMPQKSCQITYRCATCGAELWPAPGDCCVCCTYGLVPCQAVQTARAHKTTARRASGVLAQE